jgi:hypothetical protein
MESNDNGTLPEVQIRKPHFSATACGSRVRKIRGTVMSSQKSGSSGSRPVPESEHKKAGSKTPASAERTPSACGLGASAWRPDEGRRPLASARRFPRLGR